MKTAVLCDVKPEDGGKKFLRNFVSSLFENVNKFWHEDCYPIRCEI
jgi:hypothetical protein